MTCVHKVRWSVKRPENCRFRLSVSHYKDRIVAPDEYLGVTEVTPSDQTQTLQTKDKLVREDITVEGITGTQVITQNGEYDVVSDKSVTVDVPPKITFESFTTGNYPFGDVKIDPSVTDLKIRAQNQLGITSIDFQNVKKTNGETALFYGCTNLRTFYAPKMEIVGNTLFQNCFSLYEDETINLAEIMPVATTFYSFAFRDCRFAKAILPTTIWATYARAFAELSRMHTVYFTGMSVGVNSLNASTFDATVTDIYVPWSEGAIRNAPWGATGATIHYNTIYDDDWNVISST